jgi:hypothetical protein
MDTKLTLKLDKYVIERAKEYASSQKRSLSGMIESYLKTLITQEKTHSEEDIEISPFVKSFKTGVKIPVDYDYKEAYGGGPPGRPVPVRPGPGRATRARHRLGRRRPR